jgi:hypothetical protein
MAKSTFKKEKNKKFLFTFKLDVNLKKKIELNATFGP